jgi:hypothetical protein
MSGLIADRGADLRIPTNVLIECMYKLTFKYSRGCS